MFISLNMFIFRVHCSNWGTCKMGDAGQQEKSVSLKCRENCGDTPRTLDVWTHLECVVVFICCIFIYLFICSFLCKEIHNIQAKLYFVRHSAASLWRRYCEMSVQ